MVCSIIESFAVWTVRECVAHMLGDEVFGGVVLVNWDRASCRFVLLEY